MKYIIPLLVLFGILLGSLYIGNFFNISVGDYLGYILWFIGLTIMYFILPQRKENLFAKKS
jgi:hypothetical protein